MACKALGIGANVYWKDESTKYTPPPATPAPVCACCGKKIIGIKTKDGKKMTAEQAAERSKAKYGRILCVECAKKQPKEDGGMSHA